MTYRVQIITAKGEPVIDARVWSYDEAVALRTDHSQQSKACRWRYPGDKRWRYMVAGERVQSTKEMTEAFRLAGLFDQREK